MPPFHNLHYLWVKYLKLPFMGNEHLVGPLLEAADHLDEITPLLDNKEDAQESKNRLSDFEKGGFVSADKVSAYVSERPGRGAGLNSEVLESDTRMLNSRSTLLVKKVSPKLLDDYHTALELGHAEFTTKVYTPLVTRDLVPLDLQEEFQDYEAAYDKKDEPDRRRARVTRLVDIAVKRRAIVRCLIPIINEHHVLITKPDGHQPEGVLRFWAFFNAVESSKAQASVAKHLDTLNLLEPSMSQRKMQLYQI